MLPRSWVTTFGPTPPATRLAWTASRTAGRPAWARVPVTSMPPSPREPAVAAPTTLTSSHPRTRRYSAQSSSNRAGGMPAQVFQQVAFHLLGDPRGVEVQFPFQQTGRRFPPRNRDQAVLRHLLQPGVSLGGQGQVGAHQPGQRGRRRQDGVGIGFGAQQRRVDPGLERDVNLPVPELVSLRAGKGRHLPDGVDACAQAR